LERTPEVRISLQKPDRKPLFAHRKGLEKLLKYSLTPLKHASNVGPGGADEGAITDDGAILSSSLRAGRYQLGKREMHRLPVRQFSGSFVVQKCTLFYGLTL
jgi:hypothetical protein